MPKIEIDLGGNKVLGQEVAFRIVEDGTTKIELDDGAVLRVKPVVIAAFKTDERNTEGERLYVVQHLVRVVVDRPATGEET